MWIEQSFQHLLRLPSFRAYYTVKLNIEISQAFDGVRVVRNKGLPFLCISDCLFNHVGLSIGLNYFRQDIGSFAPQFNTVEIAADGLSISSEVLINFCKN